MPLNPAADVEITGFRYIPPIAHGQVRDLRVRWALEEIGRDYRVRLLDAFQPRPPEYFAEQPFGQVPAYRDREVQLFESGAILIHLGMGDERLLPADHGQRMRAIAWLIAALNDIEPMLFELLAIDMFQRGQQWTVERRPQVTAMIAKRMEHLAAALGEREWLEDRFTIGDLMMVTVLRILPAARLVEDHANLVAYRRRGEERPAFQRALASQLAEYEQNQPAAEPA